MPITPDYGGSAVSYTDGVFDLRLNRFITVMEGKVKFLRTMICTD